MVGEENLCKDQLINFVLETKNWPLVKAYLRVDSNLLLGLIIQCCVDPNDRLVGYSNGKSVSGLLMVC